MSHEENGADAVLLLLLHRTISDYKPTYSLRKSYLFYGSGFFGRLCVIEWKVGKVGKQQSEVKVQATATGLPRENN